MKKLKINVERQIVLRDYVKLTLNIGVNERSFEDYAICGRNYIVRELSLLAPNVELEEIYKKIDSFAEELDLHPEGLYTIVKRNKNVVREVTEKMISLTLKLAKELYEASTGNKLRADYGWLYTDLICEFEIKNSIIKNVSSYAWTFDNTAVEVDLCKKICEESKNEKN